MFVVSEKNVISTIGKKLQVIGIITLLRFLAPFEMTRFFEISIYKNRLSSHIITTDKRHKAIVTIINDSVGKLVIPADTGMQGRLCYTCLNLVIFNTWL